MKVKKVNGTSDRKCGCGSWLNHWHNHTNQIAQICRANGCKQKAIDGAHVKICYSSDNREYIIPLCREHNLKNGCFDINKGTDLVSANKILTCKT